MMYRVNHRVKATLLMKMNSKIIRMLINNSNRSSRPRLTLLWTETWGKLKV